MPLPDKFPAGAHVPDAIEKFLKFLLLTRHSILNRLDFLPEKLLKKNKQLKNNQNIYH